MPDRIAIVAGATGGIGQAITESLVADGFRVAALGRSADKIAAASASLSAKVDAASFQFHQVDIRDTGAVAALVQEVAQRYGRLDAVVNAAGILRFQNTQDVSVESYDLEFDTLLKGPFFLMKAAIPAMIASGGGVIVNIGSISAEKASPKMAVYAAAKAALASFTRSVALEFADKNIRAVCVQPGAVQTGLMDKIMFAMIQKKTPLKRLAQPHEVASLVGFILSEEGSYITGSTINMDGGSGL